MSQNKICFALLTGFNGDGEKVAITQRVIFHSAVGQAHAKSRVFAAVEAFGYKGLTFHGWVDTHTGFENGSHDIHLGVMKNAISKAG